jgi:hypothetical protein
MPRPFSLLEVSERTLQGEPFDLLVREFLDNFYAAPDLEKIAQEPLSMHHLENGQIKDAYLGAAAEFLAMRRGWKTPEWTESPNRFMNVPFFAGELEGLKPLLLMESPLSFRRRLIFVSENALERV